MLNALNEKQAIKNLQKYLRKLSFEENGVNTVPIDGIFDSATRDALKKFQESVSLPQTGVADKLTWDTLFSEYQKKTARENKVSPPSLFPELPLNYEISLGEELLLVRVIQLLLIELRVSYDVFEEVSESGIYDETTKKAIEELQRINLLPQTGRVDVLTWNALVNEYSRLSKERQ